MKPVLNSIGLFVFLLVGTPILAQQNNSVRDTAWAKQQAIARDILRELVEINTTPTNGSTKAATAMAKRLLAAGFSNTEVQLLGPHPDRQNLVVRMRGSGAAKPILLIAHLDVVDAPLDGWISNPFSLVERNGFFYGRGVSDNKGAAASFVAGLIQLRADGFVPERDIIVALTADEETGSYNGIRWLLSEHSELMDVAFCLNFDGGGGMLENGKHVGLNMQTCEKANISFKAEASSPGGHSSMPGKDNAIYRLSAALNRLAQYEFPIQLNETTRAYFERLSKIEKSPLSADMKALAKASPDLAAAQRVAAASPFYNAILRTTAVATRLEAGHANNALPQLAQATINCRLFPGDTRESVQKSLADALADSEIKLTYLGGGRESPVSSLLPEVLKPIEKVSQEMWPGVIVLPVMDPWATDSSPLRRAGIPTFGVSGFFGEANSDNAHGANECILVQSFNDNNIFLLRLLKLMTLKN